MSGTLNTWLSLSTNRSVALVLGGSGSIFAVVNVEVRFAGGPALESKNFTLGAESL